MKRDFKINPHQIGSKRKDRKRVGSITLSTFALKPDCFVLIQTYIIKMKEKAAV